jgi:hypothetical protein
MLLDAHNLIYAFHLYIINYPQYLTTENGYKYTLIYTITLLTNLC